MSDNLEFTGERFTPECVREIWYEHLHRYVFALGLVEGRQVLDAACGEGYGSALLATRAEKVTGVDLSAEAVQHAQTRYTAENLEFQVSDCLDLPFGDGVFDCIVSFETLEHLEEQEALLAEFRRVLSPEGFLLLSSPDKAEYTDRQGNRNEYHVSELYRDELESLLARHFPAYRLWGQKLMFHSAIWSLRENGGVSFVQEQDGRFSDSVRPDHAPTYLLALCGADESFLPAQGQGIQLFDDSAESVYAHYYHEIRKNMAAGELLAEKTREIERLEKALSREHRGSGWWRRLTGKG